MYSYCAWVFRFDIERSPNWNLNLRPSLLRGRSTIWDYHELHCVESVQLQSFFWFAFSGIRSEYGKIRTRKNSIVGHFSHSANEAWYNHAGSRNYKSPTFKAWLIAFGESKPHLQLIFHISSISTLAQPYH